MWAHGTIGVDVRYQQALTMPGAAMNIYQQSGLFTAH